MDVGTKKMILILFGNGEKITTVILTSYFLLLTSFIPHHSFLTSHS